MTSISGSRKSMRGDVEMPVVGVKFRQPGNGFWLKMKECGREYK